MCVLFVGGRYGDQCFNPRKQAGNNWPGSALISTSWREATAINTLLRRRDYLLPPEAIVTPL